MGILFLSHAALDEEIAKFLKKILVQSFSGIDVFVSSDPEDLPSGTDWVNEVLRNLRTASRLCVLATARGVSRKWVWFEAGSAWGKAGFTPLCLGALRKDQTPQPFNSYMGHNIDEVADLRGFFNSLEKDFGPYTPINFDELAATLVRLDVRAEERVRAIQSPFITEIDAEANRLLATLQDCEIEAVRMCLIQGEMTDRQALDRLRSKGLNRENRVGIYYSISSATNFVRRKWPYHDSERITGYEGPFEINPTFKDSLQRIFSNRIVPQASAK